MATFTWNGTNANGFEYKELVKAPFSSPRVKRSRDRSSATRMLLLKWSQVEEFAARAIGYSRTSQLDAGFQYISRRTPWPFPSDIQESMYVSDVQYEGYGCPLAEVGGENPNIRVITQYTGRGNNALASYLHAICTVEYETPTYEVLTDAQFAAVSPTMDESTWLRYVTKVVKPQGEFISITGTNNGYYVVGVTLGGSPMPVATTINKIIASSNYSVTWHQIPADAVPAVEYNPSNAVNGVGNTNLNYAIDKCLGRVNNKLFNGHPVGTLLLLGVEIKPMKDAYGSRIYDITYMFKRFSPGSSYDMTVAGQPIRVTPGHNHVFLPATRLQGTVRTLTRNEVADLFANFQAGNGIPLAAITPQPGWYEVMGDRTAASNETNMFSQLNGRSIYDFADFANLFRPVTWSQ